MSDLTINAATTNQWNEENSTTFLDLGELVVPKRGEQIETLLHLVPAKVNEKFTIVELAAGGGILAHAILEKFPACRYIALDGSPKMREQMALILAGYKDRVTILPFLLEEQAWRDALPTPLRCIVSSLCVHHLSDEEKQTLFQDMGTRVELAGALLLADIIKPATPRIASVFSQQYDDIVRVQSHALYGDLSGYKEFQQLQWNYFAYDYYDHTSFDTPSLLSDQLRWLREAGFTYADCFWLQAGHAIYGGYK